MRCCNGCGCLLLLDLVSGTSAPTVSLPSAPTTSSKFIQREITVMPEASDFGGVYLGDDPDDDDDDTGYSGKSSDSPSSCQQLQRVYHSTLPAIDTGHDQILLLTKSRFHSLRFRLQITKG